MLNCQFRSAAPGARYRPVRDTTGKICRWGVRNACDKADVCDWRSTARIPGTCIRASALDAGRNYNIVMVFAEGA